MYSFVTQFSYYRLVLWKMHFVCKEIGNVEISLLICDKKIRLLGNADSLPGMGGGDGGRSGVSCLFNFEGGTCNAKCPSPII